MASIDCAKFTAGGVAGLAVHFDQKKRLECDHDNPHIDKNKTHLNSFHECAGYSDMLHKQKKRVSEIDELYPPGRVRKDRVTAIMMEVPVPKSISDKGLTDQFLKDTYVMISELVGKDNMCGMTTHKDEVHDYIDHGGAVRTSLEHGHVMAVPFARWKATETVYDENGKPKRDENGKILKQDVIKKGINGKHFLTQRFLKRLQDRMQEMVLEKYGISYQTSQDPLHMTVEDLKRESARAAEIIEKAEQHAEEIHEGSQHLEQQRDQTQADLDFLQNQIRLAQRRNSDLKKQQSKLESDVDAEQEKLDGLRSEVDEAVHERDQALAEMKVSQDRQELLDAQSTGLRRELERLYDVKIDREQQIEQLGHEKQHLEQEIETKTGLLGDLQMYHAAADQAIQSVENAEKTVKALQNDSRLFKQSAAEKAIERILEMLKTVRESTKAVIELLRSTERVQVTPPTPLESERVRKRVADLDDMISAADTSRSSGSAPATLERRDPVR